MRISFVLLMFVPVSETVLKLNEFMKGKPSKRTQAQNACGRYEQLRSRVDTDNQALNEQMLICKLLRDYAPAIRPYGHGSNQSAAVLVETSLLLSSISAVNVAHMEFVCQLRLQQEWHDSRLMFGTDLIYYRLASDLHLSPEQVIWRPDTFFQNEKNGWGHELTMPNSYMLIRSDGHVTYNRRLTLTLSCVMNLKKYPMDTQRCLMDFSSYAYTEHDIRYRWADRAVRISKSVDSVLPNFRIVSVTNGTCESETTTGNYSCLRVQFTLERMLSYFVLQVYGPCCMLVAVSWVSYWIDWQSPAARAPLVIITLLTMITTQQSISQQLPPVSYTKAIDIWLGACVLFIFGALIEYAAVNFLGMNELKRKGKSLPKEDGNLLKMDSEIDSMNEESSISTERHSVGTYSTDSYATAVRHRRRVATINHNNVLPYPVPEMLYSNRPTVSYSANKIERFVHLRRWQRRQWMRLWHSHEGEMMAERLDVAARLLVPVFFCMFNIVYWLVYLTMPD